MEFGRVTLLELAQAPALITASPALKDLRVTVVLLWRASTITPIDSVTSSSTKGNGLTRRANEPPNCSWAAPSVLSTLARLSSALP